MAYLTPEASLEITNSLNEMLQCMDLGTEEACTRFADLFTNDGELQIPFAKVIKRGPEELKSLCKFLHHKFRPSTHWEGNVVLKSLNSGVISNRSYWQAFQNGQCISIGIHEDVFVQVQEGNAWKCKKRVIKHLWTKETGDIQQ
eukprot:TRINITY_DN22586_c0_g1_i1.p1 TRINITY_DN22586_c0_g1~~TRINITY_DN22586_c0_g1_i1.p1  ORF type:complete len:144 (-),score=30.99 TRINITY_DN22586_c0_g1_i1:9-440(-)